jgi:hypothetical protein
MRSLFDLEAAAKQFAKVLMRVARDSWSLDFDFGDHDGVDVKCTEQ